MKIYARFFDRHIYQLVNINDVFVWEHKGYYAYLIGLGIVINYYEMYNQVDYFSGILAENVVPPAYMAFAKEQLRDKDLVET